MRICTKCGGAFPPTREFFYKNGARLRPECKACTNARQRAYVAANHDRMKAYWLRWRAENPERARANRKRHYEENRGEMIRQATEWNAAHPEARVSIVHARRGAKPDAEGREYIAVLWNDPCSYCGGRTETIDHITAVRDGGGGEFYNLTAACAPCNSSKGTDPLLRFFLRRPVGIR